MRTLTGDFLAPALSADPSRPSHGPGPRSLRAPVLSRFHSHPHASGAPLGAAPSDLGASACASPRALSPPGSDVRPRVDPAAPEPPPLAAPPKHGPSTPGAGRVGRRYASQRSGRRAAGASLRAGRRPGLSAASSRSASGLGEGGAAVRGSASSCRPLGCCFRCGCGLPARFLALPVSSFLPQTARPWR